LSLGRAVPAGAAALMAAGAVLAGLAAPAGAAAAAGGPGEPGPVIVVGLPGLRWTDLSATATPALWRLARQGSAGSLVVSAVHTRACPADGWLTLNSGARAAADPSFSPGTGSARGGSAAPCPAMPLVVPATAAVPVNSAAAGAPALIPAMRRIVSANQPLHYDPYWGLLARAAGPGGCATAAGPGAALALAGPGGHVGSYLPSAAAVTRQVLARCPLTVIDLGALPAAPAARAAALRAADAAAGRIAAEEPAGARLMVAGLADDAAPHLRAVIVTGPGYRAGRLAAASTRQPGMTLITDLTPTVLGWRGVAVPPATVGSPVTADPRGGTSLAAVVRGLTGQDTAAQVYRSTVLAFFLIYGFGEGVVFALIALLLRGTDPARRQRRRRAYTIAGVTAGAVPAATFLASLVPWWLLPHPAVLLYGLAAVWTAVIAVVALAGPWGRRPLGPVPESRADQGAGIPRPAGKAEEETPMAPRWATPATPPGGMRGLASRLGAPGQALGPPGVVAAVTVAVIGLDVMTGSRLQLGTPFGLSALAAGRFYGVGNNALGVYGASGLLLAAWAATALGAAGPEPEPGGRRRAVLAVSAIALFVVVAAGWPGFGAKVGGTIAMVPGFLLLLAAVAGIRVTWRRALLILASGLVLVTGFAVLDYLVPSAGPSDIGAFVGHVLHGGSGGILQRKISANVGSLTTTVYSPIVPVVVVAAALILAWPHRFRLDGLNRAYAALPLLRPALAAMWLVAVLGWIADDSGVTVPAAAIPLALMLVIAVTAAVPDPAAAAGTSGDGSVKPLCREQQRRANL